MRIALLTFVVLAGLGFAAGKLADADPLRAQASRDLALRS